MEPQKTPRKIIILATVVFVVGGAAVYLMNFPDLKKAVENTQINNAQDAIVPPVEEKNVANSTTSSWKTYTNTAVGFEIEYPADWYVREESGRVGFSNVKVAGELEHLDDESYFGVTLRDNDNPNQLPVENWFKSTMAFLSRRHEPVIVGGLPAIKNFPSEGIGSPWYYHIVSGTDVIDIGFMSDQDKFIKTYEHMLSTIKFTERKENN